MIPCSKLVGISVTPYKTAAKLNPEITVASRTRRTSESLTGGSHRSLPTELSLYLTQPGSLAVTHQLTVPILHLIQPGRRTTLT